MSIFGLHVQSKYGHKESETYQKILEQMVATASGNNHLESGLTVVVFSMDRACQLQALLQSYFHFVKNPVVVRVLYKATSEPFQLGYNKLIAEYSDNELVSFVAQQQEFKIDLQAMMQQVATKNITFLVDDILFKNPVDFGDLKDVNASETIISLRLGNHITYSYTNQKRHEFPNLLASKDLVNGLEWNWAEGAFAWGYPLSVDGNIFSTLEMRILVNICGYKAPNTFEQAIQIANPLFRNRKALCFKDSILVNIPCNKVQTENNNYSGEISVTDLNQKWLDGMEIDFKSVAGIKNESTHQELPLTFIPSAHG